MILDPDRRGFYSPLTEADVPRPALEKLAALGITTLQELHELFTYGNRRLLLEYLGDSPEQFAAFRSRTRKHLGLASRPPKPVEIEVPNGAEPLLKRPRGVALIPSQRHRRAEVPDLLPAKTKTRTQVPVSLIDAFPAVRNQGKRGTCVAFAFEAFLEYHRYRGRSRSKRHSEQFLYWACKESDGIPDEEGTFLHTARDVLKQQGVCLSSTWKYQKKRWDLPESQGPPPAKAIEEARRFTHEPIETIETDTVAAIRERLNRGQPVVLSVYTYPEWDFQTTQETGEIPMPLPGSQENGAHAICVVGYEWNNRSPGGGAFIVRNSWGKGWAGTRGRFGPGHGTLFFDYVRAYGLEAFG